MLYGELSKKYKCKKKIIKAEIISKTEFLNSHQSQSSGKANEKNTKYLIPSAHKIEGVIRTQIMLFHPFTFTGKEKDEETGYGYFGARYMDHELMASFISVDRYASKYPSISPYAYCAWNPIILTDPSGDTLDVRGGAQAQADVLSIVDPKYRNRISFQNDRVNVNADGLSDEEINSDAGLSVLYRLATSEYHYLYQAEEVLDEGKPIELLCHSLTPRSNIRSSGKRLAFGRKKEIPLGEKLPDGYQGWVVFHPNLCFNGYEGGEYYSNRPSTTFHELEECYQRTDGKLPYLYRNPQDLSKEDPMRPGAHRVAIQKAEKLTPSARSVLGTEGSAHSQRIIY